MERSIQFEIVPEGQIPSGRLYDILQLLYIYVYTLA